MDRPDLAWQHLLRHRLPAVLARLFPHIDGLVDWRVQYYLPDKSLLPAAPDSRTGAREPDFVALVMLLDGRQACLHIEIQCTRQAGFADRMALYHARLRDRFDMPVFSLAILGDPSPGWRPDTSSDGCGTTFEFRIAKLLDFRSRGDDLQTLRAPRGTGVDSTPARAVDPAPPGAAACSQVTYPGRAARTSCQSRGT